MHPHSQLISDFYYAFQRRDAQAMAACYHPDVEFSDPVFVGLRHGGVTAMWRMLCERGKDLQLTFRDVQADDRTGRAHWDANYTFSTTGRKVLNRIDAEFEFRDGKIVRHLDRFDFWAWSRQALGPAGLVLGWSPMLRNKVRATARKSLDKYMQEHGIQGP
ncbi:nuclear transport factor 2 family protein [Pyxidicoccus fallax]|uniref:Nuclear transport factor 2 family protein n=1 Tax=Pyxidicoccus fallax TaxID=394095 RepID=A0A848LRT6_9BACT|nr:nuclear transport factor 2 family protein [Pyxidicoccus fallax]NMO20466.1 nuclear transport factor 2 family protein [Pyxidicoccus fallax]NPC81373.1 nuclear transport factor 2 family protein [Pyxidicoccus fallax]